MRATGDIGLTPDDLVHVPATKRKSKAKPSNGNGSRQTLVAFLDSYKDEPDDLRLQAKQGAYVNHTLPESFTNAISDWSARLRARRLNVPPAHVTHESETEAAQGRVNRLRTLLEGQLVEYKEIEKAEELLRDKMLAVNARTRREAREDLQDLLAVKTGKFANIEEAKNRLRIAERDLRGEVPEMPGRAKFGSAER